MIHLLDNTLKRVLENALPAEIRKVVGISFASPDGRFAEKLPVIDLFLLDVHENRERRSGERVVIKDPNEGAIRTRAPVVIDCTYLITAWANRNNPTAATEEHQLLGEVLRVLLRFPVLPDRWVENQLKGPDLPLPRGTLTAAGTRGGEFWQSLGAVPRAALWYTASFVFDPGIESERVPLTEEVEIRLGSKPSSG